MLMLMNDMDQSVIKGAEIIPIHTVPSIIDIVAPVIVDEEEAE